jgi:hypothetical protein
MARTGGGETYAHVIVVVGVANCAEHRIALDNDAHRIDVDGGTLTVLIRNAPCYMHD